MARNTTNARRQAARPAPQPELTPSLAKAIVEIGGTVDKSGKPNLFEIRAAAKSGDIAKKTMLLSSARQHLAEAADIMAKSGNLTTEAKLIAEREALRLYTGRVDGTISADEVSNALGDVFGRKPLTSGPKAGQPGKTPAGLGEEIRKRIVRASAAAEYVTSGDGGSYFNGLPVEPVAEIVQKLDNKARAVELRQQAERALASDNPETVATAETLSAQALQLEAAAVTLWTAQDAFAEVKRAAADSPVNAAFDPTKLAKLVDDLSADGAIAKVQASEPLMDAYTALFRVLLLIAEANDNGR